MTEENNLAYSRKKHVTTKTDIFPKNKKKKILFLVAKFAAASLLPDFLIPDSLEAETLKSRKRLNFQNLTPSKARQKQELRMHAVRRGINSAKQLLRPMSHHSRLKKEGP